MPNIHGQIACDVLLASNRNWTIVFVDLIVKVAHGPTLSSFVSRWLNHPIDFPLSAMLEPGGIGILRYSQTFVLQI